MSDRLPPSLYDKVQFRLRNQWYVVAFLLVTGAITSLASIVDSAGKLAPKATQPPMAGIATNGPNPEASIQPPKPKPPTVAVSHITGRAVIVENKPETKEVSLKTDEAKAKWNTKDEARGSSAAVEQGWTISSFRTVVHRTLGKDEDYCPRILKAELALDRRSINYQFTVEGGSITDQWRCHCWLEFVATLSRPSTTSTTREAARVLEVSTVGDAPVELCSLAEITPLNAPSSFDVVVRYSLNGLAPLTYSQKFTPGLADQPRPGTAGPKLWVANGRVYFALS
jgi:hypothetical protein